MDNLRNLAMKYDADGKEISGIADSGAMMTPVPEGQRNSTLHAWAYGRLKNHPENERQIHDDLLQRGRVSGLPDGELDQIWKSIKRSLG